MKLVQKCEIYVYIFLRVVIKFSKAFQLSNPCLLMLHDNLHAFLSYIPFFPPPFNHLFNLVEQKGS